MIETKEKSLLRGWMYLCATIFLVWVIAGLGFFFVDQWPNVRLLDVFAVLGLGVLSILWWGAPFFLMGALLILGFMRMAKYVRGWRANDL